MGTPHPLCQPWGPLHRGVGARVQGCEGELSPPINLNLSGGGVGGGDNRPCTPTVGVRGASPPCSTPSVIRRGRGVVRGCGDPWGRTAGYDKVRCHCTEPGLSGHLAPGLELAHGGGTGIPSRNLAFEDKPVLGLASQSLSGTACSRCSGEGPSPSLPSSWPCCLAPKPRDQRLSHGGRTAAWGPTPPLT